MSDSRFVKNDRASLHPIYGIVRWQPLGFFRREAMRRKQGETDMQNDRFGWILAGYNVAVAIGAVALTSFTGFDPSMLIG
jgi:hypothetical protein